jgi:WD40-like Beta Propeller Repeat
LKQHLSGRIFLAQDSLQEKLKLGIEAARRGDKAAAQILLRQVVAVDADNELAWMWLASAVESVTERRACLERALQINPNNTRAREALNRLEPAQTPRRAAEPPRRAADQPRAARAPEPEPRQSGNGPGIVTIIVGAVVLLAVIGGVIFALVYFQQANPLAAPTEVNIDAVFNPTQTPSPRPQTSTPTPFLGVIVTRAPDENLLPATFTPTFTPSPTITTTPTVTPLPAANFVMIYTSLTIGEPAPRLYRAAGDGSGEAALGEDFRDVAYDPSGERIAFVRDVIGEATSTELFIASINDLSAARQITTLGGKVSSPTWAPDGIRLAFVSDYDGDSEIWTITEDGNNITQITNNEGIDKDPAWSPDGNVIAYASDLESPELTKIFSMNPDGENNMRLTSNGGNSFAPRWSPDGGHITFVNDANSDGDIFIIEADGQGSLLLTPDDGGAEDDSPVFTPDGNWIYFVSNRGDGTFQIYRVDLRGAAPERITQHQRDDQSIDFRPELFLRLRQS